MSNGMGVGAAHFVADVLRDDLALIHLAETSAKTALQNVAETYLVQPQIAVLVAFGGCRSAMSSAGTISAKPSASTTTPSVRPWARRLTTDPAIVSTIAFQSGVAPVILLGDQRQRRACRLPDAEREVACLAPHRHDEVPAAGGLRIDHQVVHDLDADGARGLVTERPDVVREIEIVVDRLRHVHDPQPPAGRLRELVAVNAVSVAADGEEHSDVQRLQRGQTLRMCSSRFVGFAREMPMHEPPRK